jgi:MFS transporter, ACS family, hexuronate transporter
VLFSIAFVGQQSWSTLVMILPTDLFPRNALGTVAGFVGLGGALGGVVLGQLAGYLLDAGFSYTPVLVIAGSLHVIAFLLILATVRTLQPLRLGATPESSP